MKVLWIAFPILLVITACQKRHIDDEWRRYSITLDIRANSNGVEYVVNRTPLSLGIVTSVLKKAKNDEPFHDIPLVVRLERGLGVTNAADLVAAAARVNITNITLTTAIYQKQPVQDDYSPYTLTVLMHSTANGARYEICQVPMDFALVAEILKKWAHECPGMDFPLIIYLDPGLTITNTVPLLSAVEEFNITNVTLRLNQSYKPRMGPQPSRFGRLYYRLFPRQIPPCIGR